MTVKYNAPPDWPQPPAGWVPPQDWRPNPSWPPPPPGWQLWVDDSMETAETAVVVRSKAAADEVTPERNEAVSVPVPVDTDGQVPILLARIAQLEKELATCRAAAHTGGDALVELDDRHVLQDVGVYRYHHPLENAASYTQRLTEIETQMTKVIREDAVFANDMFTLGGSLAKGRKMVADLSKLMLRAYNAEADNCVRALRSGNVTTAKARLERSVTAIERLGQLMEMRINPDYHSLRVAELELTADYQMKLQEEKEIAKEQRQLLREQRQAESELAAEKARLEKEHSHYSGALAVLRANGDTAAADELQARLDKINQAIVDADYRIANIRAGYVYVISNIGAFGPDIVKIGLTRRLDPLDRVKELGDASVPFGYDVHALYFAEDAVTLENKLHKTFADRRVNWVNHRREFFFATPSEVKQVLQAETGGLLEFTEQPTAVEFLTSRSSWPQPDRTRGPVNGL